MCLVGSDFECLKSLNIAVVESMHSFQWTHVTIQSFSLGTLMENQLQVWLSWQHVWSWFITGTLLVVLAEVVMAAMEEEPNPMEEEPNPVTCRW